MTFLYPATPSSAPPATPKSLPASRQATRCATRANTAAIPGWRMQSTSRCSCASPSW